MRLNEEMVVIVENNASTEQSSKRSSSKYARGKANAPGHKHHEQTEFLVDIDHDVIREMYPVLCSKYESTRGMNDIHYVLQMSDWDSVKADECLVRRGSLRSIKRAASSGISLVSQSQPDTWQCRDCTFINPAVETECSLCECPSTLLPPCPEYTRSYIDHVLMATRRTEIESQCFICHDGGELINCSVRSCRKVYHPVCVGLDPTQKQQIAKQKWYCPRSHTEKLMI